MANFIQNNFQQNYYTLKGIAYTEDKIPVQKLFLYKIAAELTRPQLQDYFNGFGRVVRLHIFGKEQHPIRLPRRAGKQKRSPQTSTGYVFFSNPRDAAKVLNRKSHIIQGKRFSVQPSDSWHQPSAYHPSSSRPTLDMPVQLGMDMSSKIMQLNDYCLENVFKCLPLVDQLHFSRTCSRFNAIYQSSTVALHKNMQFDDFDKLTVWDMRDFFSMSGAHVQKFEGIVPLKHRQRFLEFFDGNCKEVKVLDVRHSELNTRHLYKMLANLPKLEKLKLRACSLPNSSISALKNLHSLKFLDLSENYVLTGAYMNRLPSSIEWLTLTECNLEPNLFIKCCKALPQLKMLDLREVRTFTTETYQQIPDVCPDLQILKMTACSLGEYEHIAKIPSLKTLIIYAHPPPFTLRLELFKQLVDHKAQQLEHFEVCGPQFISSNIISQISKLSALRKLVVSHNDSISDNEMQELCQLTKLEQLNLKNCPNVSDNAVIRLLIACPKLHILNLEQCKHVSNDMVYEIIRKMGMQIKNKEKERQLPIQLFVADTNINDFMLNDPDYVAAKHIVNMTFEHSPPDFMLEQYFNNLFNMQDLDFDPAGFDFDSEDDSLSFEDMFDVGFMNDEDEDMSEDELFDLYHNMENDDEIGAMAIYASIYNPISDDSD